ncbi:phage protein Gp36 family protein [Aurantimonas sp. C2-6-R+9]|uniref:phage protein Gp36 family protein n=1 Tax=unclassified Aurantimonas TaxID=2638230 RepID=UPI002E16FA4E|nr:MULTISPECIES: phage protein Gp36 family protein [unclassified Aurantimonas]MEC5291977.1 phage protein Gp36 family protein [Aurantimonas sp. C2-3-R2]MEC5382089.1 phage protein Gp36 family protein [Aurantimonas sp. C2-6-R+9]MEC5413062.1 phage protein Gp36 family protein [Aurantimonas sp. C2-4-R8]
MTARTHIDRIRFATIVGEEELLQLASDGRWNTPDGPTIDEAKLTAALDHANALVEGYARGRYPDGVESALLTEAAADIARYRLRSTANATTVSKEVCDRFDDAMRLLRDIQSGRQQLTAEDGTIVGTSEGAGGTIMVSRRLNPRNERGPSILEGFL